MVRSAAGGVEIVCLGGCGNGWACPILALRKRCFELGWVVRVALRSEVTLRFRALL